jgi:transposase
MKTINIKLSSKERKELLKIRQKSTDYRNERALAVLHCDSGKRPCQIAALLMRSSQTICQWLNSYKQNGIKGLDKKFSPGRPSLRKTELIPRLSIYLASSPRDFGWYEDIWSVKVIMAQFKKETGRSICRHTVIRALSDAGYSSKRGKKTTPIHAPSKEEKLKKVRQIAAEINALKETENVEVMFLDESHFSTEPYVIRGWSKKGEPFFPPDSQKERKLHYIWGIRTQKRYYLLEEFQKK